MAGRLVIDGTVADINENIPFPLSYAISDVREPDKRKRNSSKTVKLPATKTNRQIFKSVFSLSITDVKNLDGLGFDTSVNTPCEYYVDDILQFKGLIQLMDIEQNGEDMTFNCILLSEFVDLFKYLSEVNLNDIGWGEYNHTLSKTNIEDSWDTSVIKDGVATTNFVGGNPQGFGYNYPIIDWGYSDNIDQKKFKTSDLIPCVYVKEAFEKCFGLLGFTIDSDFMSGAAGDFTWRKLLLGWEGGANEGLEASDRDDLEVDAQWDLQVVSSQGLSQSQFNNETTLNRLLQSDVCTITETNDPSDQLNAAGRISIYETGLYNFNFTGVLRTVIDFIGTATHPEWKDIEITTNINIFINGNFNSSPSKRLQSIRQHTISGVTSPQTNDLPLADDIQLSLNSGDTVLFQVENIVRVTYNNPSFINAIEQDVETTTGLNILMTNLQPIYEDGSEVNIARYVPKMKASDFVKGMINMFNLYVSDPDTDGVIKIEPLDDFYQDTDVFDDWSSKIDYSKPIKITPAQSLIDASLYTYDFEEDSDYLNNLYKATYQENYGSYNYQTSDGLSKGVKNFKLPFAVSIPQEMATDFIMPRVVKISESGVVTAHSGKPRIFLYNGLYSTSWSLTNSSGSSPTVQTSYPLVHHLDDIDTPTFDLLWSYPKFVYYPADAYTTNNLFQFQQKNVLETTSPDAKLLTCYVKFNPADVFNLDFTKLKMINGSLFKINSIKDYDAQKNETAQVELLRVLEASNSGGSTAGGKPPTKRGQGNDAPYDPNTGVGL